MADKILFCRKIQKEMASFIKDPPPGMVLDTTRVENNFTIWNIRMKGANDTLYAGEEFNLQIKFGTKYPFKSPQVTFVGENIPVHPHVYSNGHICLSILTDDWSPALSIHAVCVSILSMLSSCKEKKLPEGNNVYLQMNIDNPQEVHWLYHDDEV